MPPDWPPFAQRHKILFRLAKIYSDIRLQMIYNKISLELALGIHN